MKLRIRLLRFLCLRAWLNYQLYSLPEYLARMRREPCVYCGEPSDTRDHIRPKSMGGTSNWENLAPACNVCNLTKGSQSLLRYLVRQRLETPAEARARKKKKYQRGGPRVPQFTTDHELHITWKTLKDHVHLR